jgi:uncharacterized protein YutD
MKFKIFILFFVLSIAYQPSFIGQELLCNVTVRTNNVQSSVTRVYESLRNDIRDFMNNQNWTNDRFSAAEKIKCNIFITIEEQVGITKFKASIQVQSSRPVFNSGYSSPVLNLQDNEFDFEYVENTALTFSLDQFRSNLTSVLAYYAYIIIGYDYDTFSMSAGTPFFMDAKQIVDKAQSSPQPGWRAFSSDQNRYWIVENILNSQFKPFRECLYQYHRLGLDEMYNDVVKGRENTTSALEKLLVVHRASPTSYNTQIFFKAKADEIVGIYSNAQSMEKTKVYNILQTIDPANMDKYQKLKD